MGSDLEVKAGSFPEGVGLSGSGATPAGDAGDARDAVEAGLWRVREGSLMHLRLGVVQWATFMVSLNTHSVRLDVPAFRLNPALQTYRSLELRV